MSVLTTAGTWASAHDGRWSGVVLERAEHGVADTLAAIIAAGSDPVTRKVRDAAAASGAGASRTVGSEQALTASSAALVNGTAAHVLELDDNFYPALTHASAAILPALLAIGDETEASGADVLDAYIVGLELHALLGRGVNRSHYFAGWHPTATVGCIGTAGACARLLGLDGERTTQAMSIAVSMAAGNKAQFGTEVKPLQCGTSALHAVLAVRLAEAGIEGNPEVLEDPQGFLALYGGPHPRGWDEPLRKLGNPLALDEYGLAPKRHACCGSAHNTLDNLLDLRAEHGFAVEDIEEIDVLIGASNRKNLRFDDPRDAFEARFSLQYSVAVLLLRGEVTLKDFTPDAVARPEVRALFGLTKIRALSFDEEPLDPDVRPAHSVRVTLKDGRVLTRERVFAKGIKQDPFSDAERAAKVRACTEDRLEPSAYAALVRELASIRSLPSIRSLTAILAEAKA
ncbi:MmgE/PrpD family protein [Nocardiopsis mangrovi]|uniref:MmgE/PrpD family protein n=1 Tax=Nocardiopsis mangrovi TaxID=1179818 RepID=A0ABV9DZL0_9ACTN